MLWPLDVLPPREIAVDLAPRSLAGPSSVSGFAQVVASDAGLWTITYGSVPVVTPPRVKMWRTMDVLLEGRLNPVLVPISNRYQPFAEADADLYDAVPHSDDAFFADGSGYVLAPVIDVIAAGGAALRATSIAVTINYAAVIEPGQHFSIGERMYRVRTVTYTDATHATITFRPPLREAVTAGARLEFDNPVCRMRLASDDSMRLSLDYNLWSFPSVSFIEDV